MLWDECAVHEHQLRTPEPVQMEPIKGSATIARRLDHGDERGVSDRSHVGKTPILETGGWKPETVETSERIVTQGCERLRQSGRLCERRKLPGIPGGSSSNLGHLNRRLGGGRCRLGFNPTVALFFEFESQFFAARLHDAAVREHVHGVGHDVVQETLIMRDYNHRP